MSRFSYLCREALDGSRWAAVLLVTCLAVGLTPSPGRCLAQETILSFDSQIQIAESGELTVTETIRVRSEQKAIKRGIYRDFPTLFRTRYLLSVALPFEVASVTRDGQPETYVTESLANGVRIRIGRADVMLPRGEHEYQITYRTRFQIAHEGEQDELYWNATANDWAFPIETASATVRFPQSVDPQQLRTRVFTGSEGDRNDVSGPDASITVEDDGSIVYRTTKPLGARQGLTLVAGFPKGVVRAPTPAEERMLYLRANTTLWLALGSLAVLLLYYFVAWLAVGRDPPGGVIYPLFDPPDGMGPAGVRYIRRMAYDRKCFTAALLNLAVKQKLTIEEKKDGEFEIERRNQGDSTKELTPYEKTLYQDLLGAKRQRLKLKQSNHKILNSAVTNLAKGLRSRYEGLVFKLNRMWLVPAWILSAILFGVVCISCGGDGLPVAAFLSLWLSVWTVGCTFLVFTALTAWRSAFRLRKNTMKQLGSYAEAIGLTLFCLPFLAGEFFAIGVLISSTSWFVAPLLLGILILHLLFWYLIKQPTVEGQRLRDQVEGFRMYLGTAERDYLARAHPPEKTPELYERYLPYALALDVENEWAEQFSDVLERAARGTDGQTDGYHPTWYRGGNWSSLSKGAALGALGTALGGAIAVAATAPASRGSGGGGFSSGGGFSGGGGGGGGGGGW